MGSSQFRKLHQLHMKNFGKHSLPKLRGTPLQEAWRGTKGHEHSVSSTALYTEAKKHSVSLKSLDFRTSCAYTARL